MCESKSRFVKPEAAWAHSMRAQAISGASCVSTKNWLIRTIDNWLVRPRCFDAIMTNSAERKPSLRHRVPQRVSLNLATATTGFR